MELVMGLIAGLLLGVIATMAYAYSRRRLRIPDTVPEEWLE